LSLREAVMAARSADANPGSCEVVLRRKSELERLLREIERSDDCVWRIVKVIDCSEDERAMIAQIVAPALAGMTPGSVLNRY
jgi:hypothetical protein